MAAGLSYWASALVAFNVWDVWFEANLPRNYSNMVALDSDPSRSNVHPLYSLLVYPPTKVLFKTFGFPLVVAVRVVLSLAASLWVTLLFLALRSAGCHRPDAGLLSLLGLTSAAAIFWLPVPETYPVGSCSILLPLLLMNKVPRTSFWWYLLINVVSLSVTVTNWMVGLMLTLVNQGWKRTLYIGMTALMLVGVLGSLHNLVVPSVKLPFGQVRDEGKYLFRPEAVAPINILRSLLFHSMVMPEIVMVDNDGSHLVIQKERGTVAVDLGKRMSTQPSSLGSGTSWGRIAVMVWGCLLVLGIWALLTMPGNARFRLVLAGVLCGQVLLHLLYGEETFLYTIHVVPLLILMVGMATLTAVRPMVLALAALLIIPMGANNVHQFKAAVERQDNLTRPYNGR
jgi:hypothetical protein